ncbi:MAG TPA: SpoIIE family protein phosphatase, partial [Oscillatoriaceae cyanobacterium]
RQAELGVLTEALRRAQSGAGSGVFLGAHPGLGKSRLIQELKLHCQLEHVPVLSASCTVEGMGAYDVVRQVLQAALPLADGALREPAERLLRQLSPGEMRGPMLSKNELHQAIRRLLAAFARPHGLVICVDDLQWADTLSLEVLTQCLYGHADAPILWLGSYRPDEISQRHAVSQALEEKLAQSLVLEPFDEEECAEVVCGALGVSEPPAGLISLIEESAQGNCFFVLEMLRYLVDQGHLRYRTGIWRLTVPDDGVGLPNSIHSLVCRRLEGLSAPASQLARLGAVLAETLQPAQLRVLGALSEQVLLDAINELVERRVWVCTGRVYRFVHDRVREAIYEAIPGDEREAWHARIAERLEALGAPAATLAFHRTRGPEPLAGVPALRQAGDEAERLGAMQEAFKHWTLAAELLEQHRPQDERLLCIWLDIGIKCGFSVDSRAGEEALEKALARLERLGNSFLAARIMGVAIAGIRCLPGFLSRPILKALSRPVPFKPARGWRRWLPPNYLALVPLLIEVNTWLTICCNTNGKIAKAYAVNRKAQALVPDRRSWAWGVVMTAYAYSHVLEGRFDESIAFARDAFALLREETSLQAIDISCGALVLANNQVYQGEPIVAPLSAELAGRSAAHQMTEWQGMVQYAGMVHHVLTGRSPEAQLAIAEAQPYSRRCGRGTVLEREIRLAQSRLHALRGEFDQALEVIDGAIGLDAVVELPYFTSRLFEIRGRVHLERGEWALAQSAFEEVIAREQAYGLKFTLPDAYLGLAEVHRQRGEVAQSRGFVARAREILDTPAYRCEIKRIWLLRQEGRLAMSERRFGEANERLEAALRLARTQSNLWQCALTLTEMGRVRRAAGEEGMACFQEALALFEALDNPYGAQQVRQLLAMAGESEPEELLQRFTAAIMAAPTEAAVLESLLAHAQQALHAERAVVVQWTPAGLMAIAGENVEHSGPEVSLAFVQHALDGRILCVEAQRSGWRLALPLDASLALYADWTGVMSGNHQELAWLLRAMGAAAKIALHNARGMAEEHHRAARLKILNEMSTVLAGSRDTEQVLDHLLLQVLKLTGVEQVLVIVRAGERYDLLAVRTAEDYALPPSFSQAIVERVIGENASLCVLDTEGSIALASQSVIAMGLKSVIAVPLTLDETQPGALYVSSRLSSRAFNDTDLELLRAIAAWASIAYQHARQARWLESHASQNEQALAKQQAEQTSLIEERREIDQELSLARSIQQGFFPAPPRLLSLDVHGACHAAREVGGDFYDVIALEGERVAIAIGDVSGKGVSAALYMAVVRTAIRMALPGAESPRQCLIDVNKRLREDLRDGTFVTCFLGIFDERTSRLSYASAGHQMAYLVGDGIQALTGRGVPLGMDPDVFEAMLAHQERVLAPGDRVALVTDGVVEALDPDAQEFGEERLLAALEFGATEAEQAVTTLISRVREHVAGAPAWDDMTVLVAQVAPAARA